MTTLWQDIRYGVRMLMKNHAFTTAAVLTLALGIGANTAMFSVVEAVLLRPLPYPDSGRLAWLSVFYPGRESTMVVTPEYLSWRSESQTLEEMAAYSGREYDLTGVEVPERLQGAAVTAGFFGLLGIRPACGRAFLAEEDRPGGPPAVVLSHALWQRLFSSNPDVLGTSVTLNGASHTVVGVLPADFRFPDDLEVDVLGPLALPAEPDWNAQGFRAVSVLGRMKPGIALEQTKAELETISHRADGIVSPLFARTRAGLEVRVVPLHERLVGNVRLLLYVLSGAVAFILLIACANVAHLGLARSTVRRKEIVLRAALGAGRGRLIRQLLVESVLLAVLGAMAGLLLAALLPGLLRVMGAQTVALLDRVALNGPVLVFTALVAGAAVLLFGLAPALLGTGVDLNETFQEGGRAVTGGHRRKGLRNVLMAGEVALALVLFVGAGLLIRSFASLAAVDPGFRADHVLTLQLRLPMTTYSQAWQRAEFVGRMEEQIRSLPGVRSVGVTSQLPLTGFSMRSNIPIEGQPDVLPGQSSGIPLGAVSPDYFRAMGIQLIAGRLFDQGETSSSPPVAIVNESFSHQFFPGEDPLGRRIMGQGASSWRSIVGVVADVHHSGLASECSPEVFLPFAQSPWPNFALAVRTDTDPSALAEAIRRSVAGVDRNQCVYDVVTMEERLAKSVAPQRYRTIILAVFAVVALSLAGVGVYGMTEYVASQRIHEIGIRMALGATGSDVLKTVLGTGFKVTMVGVMAGLAGALTLTRVVSSFLYGISPTDPVTFVCTSLLLTAVALLACYIPARRAARVDPMVALRCE
ncbi:MAG: ABC transporter permease [Phycisphaerales bacterium]